MGNHIRMWIAAGVVCVSAMAALPANAQQETHKFDPFFENLLFQSQAYGFEMVGQRLNMAQAFAAPVNPALVPQLQRMELRDFARFRGTLAKGNPALEKSLAAALHDVMADVQGGKAVTAEVVKARALLAQAYDVVVDPAVQKTTHFKAAVLANLLMANDGVAEAFEDAIRENWGYPNGWAAVRRVEVLWAEIAPQATPAQRAEGNGVLDVLKSVFYAKPEPKIPFPAEEAEDVEALAIQMVGLIELVGDSYLHTGRDLRRLATHLAAVTTTACEAYERGDDAIGVEGVSAVLDHYRVQLAGTLDLISVNLRQKATQVFPRLVEVEYDFYEGFENLPPDTRQVSNAQLCRELVTVFNEAAKDLH